MLCVCVMCASADFSMKLAGRMAGGGRRLMHSRVVRAVAGSPGRGRAFVWLRRQRARGQLFEERTSHFREV